MSLRTSQIMRWNEETYKQIPYAGAAFRHARQQRVSEDVFEEIRSIFLKHQVEQKLALCVVHRHFDLDPDEQLVQFNNVTAPWKVDESPDYLRPGVTAKNWAFMNGGDLFPYEFRFDADLRTEARSAEEENGAVPFPLAFSSELYSALSAHDMHDIYGLTALEPDDVDMTTPSKMEFTAGRTSVVVSMTPEMERMEKVDAIWVFPCATPFTGAFGTGPNGFVKTRVCALSCKAHTEPDPNPDPNPGPAPGPDSD